MWHQIDYKKKFLFIEWKLKQIVLLCPTSAGNVYMRRLNFFTALPMSTNDYESAMSTDLGVTHKF